MEAHERYSGPIIRGIRFRVGDGTEYTVDLFDPAAKYSVIWKDGGADTEEHFRTERRVTHVPPEVLADGWVRLRKVGVNHLQKDEEWYCLDMTCNARAVYGVRVGGDGACEAHARSRGVFRKEGLPETRIVTDIPMTGKDVPVVRTPGRGWKMAPEGRVCSAEVHVRALRRVAATYLKTDFSGITSCVDCAVRMGVFGDPDVAELRAELARVTKGVTLAAGWATAGDAARSCQAEGCDRTIEFSTNDGRRRWCCSVHAASFGVFGGRTSGEPGIMMYEVVKERGPVLAPGWKRVAEESLGKFYSCTLPDGNIRHGVVCGRSGGAVYINRGMKGFPGACETHAAENGVFMQVHPRPVREVARARLPDIQAERTCPCTRSLPDLCWIHVAPKKGPRPPVSRATVVGTYHASMEKLSATGQEKFETGVSPLGRATHIDRERIPPTLTELACARVWKGYRNGPED